MAEYPAKATDFTLSDSAIMSLDYNLSNSYTPPLTATITSKQDISGTGVEFNIHFPSPTNRDCSLFQVSDKSYGAGTLAGFNVSAYSNFVLKFTVLSIDGSTSGSGLLDVGALIGGAGWGFHPQIISLTGQYPSSAVSTTRFTSASISVIGFTVSQWPFGTWAAGPHDISLLVQPSDGAVQIAPAVGSPPEVRLSSSTDALQPLPGEVRRTPFRRGDNVTQGSDDASTNTPATVLSKGSYETVQAKILKVFAVDDNGAKFRAYLVRWKDFDVVVSDILARGDKKEGDTITFTVNRMELPNGASKTSVLTFTSMPFPDRIMPYSSQHK
jgi:hypothetical protein